jgi:hypothetical protein
MVMNEFHSICMQNESSFMKFIRELSCMDVVEFWTPLWEGWFLGPCIFFFIFKFFLGV